ncbi:MFI2 [Cordylochernes scorpioides]|uniref:MFI2 n=1 Tax=Cordylochernes scorpioides TaxID=51811 RepID=A0ABY6KT37_9ARAC|nr:MFI2 [Cordylochernes scorpioides]
MGVVAWVLVFGCLGGLASAQIPSQAIRLCVDAEKGQRNCPGLEADTNLECIYGKDKLDCIKKVAEGKADLMEVDEHDIYIAGRWYNLAPIAHQYYSREREFRYQSVVLVKKNLNIDALDGLKNRKACFTGVGRTAGYELPLAVLREEGAMQPQPHGDLASAANFFGPSCAPGELSADPIISNYLKEKYPSLQQLCPNPQQYAGYEGALKCLNEGLGEVAFTKLDALDEYIQKNPEIITEAKYLCVDGSTRDLTEAPCTWANRPLPAFVAKDSGAVADSEIKKNQYVQELKKIFRDYGNNRPSWFNNILVNNGDKIIGVENIVGTTYRAYLGRFLATIEKPEYGKVRWCVTSDKEESKCQDFSAQAYARRIRPVILCHRVESQSQCINGGSDIVTLDGGDVYMAGRYHGFVPLAAEYYGSSDNSYFSVAVVRADSGISSLADLRDRYCPCGFTLDVGMLEALHIITNLVLRAGKKSCHTGLGRTAGWVVPVGTLIDMGLLQDNVCDREAALADFVSAACVPGSNNPQLCAQCIGDEEGNNRCARNSAERYSGYGGALRCLAENAGDVAFVKHSTVQEFADGASDEPWAAQLRSQDFKLLCRQPGNLQPVENYENCHLASNPAHYVMVRGDMNPEQQLALADMMAEVNLKFAPNNPHFKLFAPYDGVPDLLFKDYVSSLRPVIPGITYRQALGEHFYKASEALDPQQCRQQRI